VVIINIEVGGAVVNFDVVGYHFVTSTELMTDLKMEINSMGRCVMEVSVTLR
jgi:hypothetical protein